MGMSALLVLRKMKAWWWIRPMAGTSERRWVATVTPTPFLWPNRRSFEYPSGIRLLASM